MNGRRRDDQEVRGLRRLPLRAGEREDAAIRLCDRLVDRNRREGSTDRVEARAMRGADAGVSCRQDAGMKLTERDDRDP